jgi:hypothetical protein
MKIFLLSIFISFCFSCATVTRGVNQALTITSSPSGANVTLSTGEECLTPCTLELRRGDDYTALIELDGYQSIETSVLSQRSDDNRGSTFGSFMYAGLQGIAVDMATGALNELVPNPLHVDLEPIDD